jgi:hypothetical protein
MDTTETVAIVAAAGAVLGALEEVVGVPMLGLNMKRSPSAIAAAAAGDPFHVLSDKAAAGMRPVRADATKAYNALAELGGHEEEDLLHEGATDPLGS